jgi:hypothetical protein
MRSTAEPARQPRAEAPQRDGRRLSVIFSVAEYRRATPQLEVAMSRLEEARAAVEQRYLDGVGALFPSGVRAWEYQRHAREQMAVIVDRLAELDGLPRPQPDDHAFAARVAQLTADHVHPARSRAYEQLGDTVRAMEPAVSWLRPELESASRA